MNNLLIYKNTPNVLLHVFTAIIDKMNTPTRHSGGVCYSDSHNTFRKCNKLHYKQATQVSGKSRIDLFHFNLSLSFKTKTKSGALLFLAYDDDHSDYMSLHLNKVCVVFTIKSHILRYGSMTSKVCPTYYLPSFTDGSWFDVTVQGSRNSGSLFSKIKIKLTLCSPKLRTCTVMVTYTSKWLPTDFIKLSPVKCFVAGVPDELRHVPDRLLVSQWG